MKMFLEENDFIAKQGSFCFSGINVFCHQDLTLSCVKIQTQFSFITLYVPRFLSSHVAQYGTLDRFHYGNY